MKITLVGEEFNAGTGKGIFKVAEEAYIYLKKQGHNVQKIPVGNSKNPFGKIFRNIFINSYKLLNRKSDIYHFLMPEISFPCLFKKPSVVTVHDLIPLVLKNERKKIFNIYFRIMVGFIKRADHLIAISQSTKRELMEILNIPEEKITVIYHGVNHNRFYPLKKRKSNKKVVIGFLGGLVKRKNARILLDVAKQLEKENILFRIGGKGKGLDKLIKRKEKLKLNNVEFLGFIPDNKLNKFYNSLDLFLVPTIYDGFSLPGLEAMTTGCPIMASKGGAIPEVAGNAGILINPKNVKEISSELKKFIKDKRLQKEMKGKSIKHAEKFRLEKESKETEEVYLKVLKCQK